MTDGSTDERLTYDEVDEVLRRATELEHGDPKGEGSFSLAEIERLGREIGLSPEAIQTALVHVRSEALMPAQAARRGWIDRILGPGEVVVRRRVKGPVAEVWTRINAFMDEQLFGVRRNFGQRVLWGPKDGLVSQFRRALDVGERYTIRVAEEVEAAVMQLPGDGDYVEVVLIARVHESRRKQTAGSAVVFGIMIGVGGLVALPLAPISAVGAAVSVATGAGLGGVMVSASRRAQRKRVASVHNALAHLLDVLEHER